MRTRQTREQKLVAFAEHTLLVMEVHTDWSPDTLDDIAKEAHRLDLAHDEGGLFTMGPAPKKEKVKK